MRRWMAAPIVATALAVSTPALAQPAAKAAAPVEETFKTADGVQLHGMFHKSAGNPGSDPVVILLYPPGKDNDMNKGDWAGLADRLATAGFNVFRFDWRGHGKSTEIKDTDKFWNLGNPQPNPFTGLWNHRMIKGAPPPRSKAAPKDTLKFTDFPNPPIRYAPVLLTDLAAVRAHLDAKNDSGDVNTSSIYLIGAGDAATLGFAWLAVEWNRPAFAPTPNQLGIAPQYAYVPQDLRGAFEPAGADISACVWLTPTLPSSVRPALLQGWVSGTMNGSRFLPMAPKTRENNPMQIIYSNEDRAGKNQAEMFFNEVLVANPKAGSPLRKAEGTFLKEVKAKTLSGVSLLGNNDATGTEAEIMKFLNARQKDRAALIRKPRGFTAPYFVALEAFGLPRP